MKTINNMKAMEMNGEMLDRVIGGSGMTEKELREYKQNYFKRNHENTKAVTSAVFTGYMSALTLGLYGPVNTGYQLVTGRNLFESDKPSLIDKVFNPEMR